METSSFYLALVLLILNSITLTTTTTSFSSSSLFSNSTTDQDALLAFKNGINLDPNSILINSWSTNTSICNWTGVSCSIKHHRVTALNLSGFHLRGTISPHLGNLTFLQSLDMSLNNFIGSVPSQLFNISGLQAMNLSSNQLTGALPNGICTPKLKRIDLSTNRFYGKIPKSIYQCTELVELRLFSNQFNGNIPSEIGNLTMLRCLDIFDNHLEGEIPSSIFNITALENLYLNKNSLSGSIPIFNGYTRLQYLYLDRNYLTGHLPKQIGNLTLLNLLYIECNNLKGELPGELGNLKNIEVFRAFQNEFLNGIIPPSIFNISTLQKLGLQENQFSGSLPPNMGISLFNLVELLLYSNRLSGKIPTSITNASMLAKLGLESNSFTGSIPNFGNLRFLQDLRLRNNNLTGAESPIQELAFLSSLTNCRDLKNLELSDNPMMNGILPPSVWNLSTSLISFTISNCSIRGAIPSGFGNLSSLLTLDLSKNKLVGFIPATMGMLTQLGKLYLYDNQLRGYIPHDLCQISKLMNLYLSGNRLTGPIPECFGKVKSLRKVSLASNSLNSTLPSKFLNPDLIILNLSSNNLSGQLPYQVGSLRAIYWLDLSSNKFSGIIPSSIDGCESLEYLYLSNNMFDGSIPQSLGKVKGLRALYLSNNNLSGLIPKSLENLKLEWFNVSDNQLEGKIPEEGCFVNFSASSFLNNSALCGAERFQVPSCRNNHPRSTSKDVALIMKYVVPSFIAFMFVVVGILVLIRRWRPKEKLPKIENTSVDSGWKIVSAKELEQGTSSFSEMNLLGRGGIGSVFKATLADGTQVAVKVFNLQVEGATKIFDTESRILGTVRHRNLVKTLGCCSNTGFKALILAYMPNGSLDECLHSNKHCLGLVERVKIATDVAFALEYLHHGHTFPVVHCDIKPSNVLLDEDMTAHVGDFGISKLFDNGEAAVHTITMATIGYAAPEFGSEGKVSMSGDVYSYGILLLEIFTSKRPIDDMFSGEMSIKEWVSKALQENAMSEVVAPGLLSREDGLLFAKEQCVSSIFDLAMRCLAFSPEERINMMQVVAALQKIQANFRVEEIQKKHRKS